MSQLTEATNELLNALAPIYDAISLFLAVFVIAFLTSPIWLRAVNEVTTRTVGRAVVICPYCGVPGIVESTHPKVFQ